MLRIEFPSACAADVRGPQAADLCGAARALLGDFSPLKTTTHTHTNTHQQSPSLPGPGCQLHANYCLFPPFLFSSLSESRTWHMQSYLHVYYVVTLWENRCSINSQPAGSWDVLKWTA